MKKLHKHLMFVAVTILAGTLLFAACGGNDNDGHDPRAFQEVPAGDWNTPFAQPVNVTAVGNQGAHWAFASGDSVAYSPWTRLFAEELNIHVDFLWTSVEEYDTRLNMDIAAGNIPDVFHIPTANILLFNQLLDAGMLLDLTDAYNNYASQRIRDFQNMDPYTIQGFMRDGRIYGIPRYYYGQIDQPWHMWIRNDWHQAAGSPEIRTVADLENLARYFMDVHGASYGIAVANDLQWLFRTAPMFGAYIGNVMDHQYFWMPDETGRLRPGISFPEFMVALEHWQRWFAEGIISADFATMDNPRVEEDIVNGLVGIQPWWQWWGWMNGPTITALQGEDAIFYPFNLPTLDGNPARGQIFFPNLGVIVASAEFENPAALMKILSMVEHMRASPDANLTPEQLSYFMDDDREHSMTDTFSIINPATDMEQFIYVAEALRTGDSSQLFTTGMQQKYTQSMAWINNREPHGIGAYLQMGAGDRSAYARSQHLFDNNRTVQTGLWGPLPPEFAAAGTTGDLILEEVTQIIMGNRPVSHFETVLEQWYAQGGQLKEDIVNELFGNGN